MEKEMQTAEQHRLVSEDPQNLWTNGVQICVKFGSAEPIHDVTLKLPFIVYIVLLL
jgi:hypothetical protein